MGNSCSASCPLNICLNVPRTSSQAEDEILQAKSMDECAIIEAREKQTASVNKRKISLICLREENFFDLFR